MEDLRQDRTRIHSLETQTRTIEVQFAQWQSDVRLEFSAVHEEIRAGFERVDDRFAKVEEEFGKAREEIRQGDEETRRFMRVLHEDLVGRIAVLGEQFRRA